MCRARVGVSRGPTRHFPPVQVLCPTHGWPWYGTTSSLPVGLKVAAAHPVKWELFFLLGREQPVLQRCVLCTYLLSPVPCTPPSTHVVPRPSRCLCSRQRQMDGTLSLAGGDNSRGAELPGAAAGASAGSQARWRGAPPGSTLRMARQGAFEPRGVSPTRPRVPGAGGGKGGRGRAGSGGVPALVRCPRCLPARPSPRAERPSPAALSL